LENSFKETGKENSKEKKNSGFREMKREDSVHKRGSWTFCIRGGKTEELKSRGKKKQQKELKGGE